LNLALLQAESYRYETVSIENSPSNGKAPINEKKQRGTVESWTSQGKKIPM
jgi:hypothetical protein